MYSAIHFKDIARIINYLSMHEIANFIYMGKNIRSVICVQDTAFSEHEIRSVMSYVSKKEHYLGMKYGSLCGYKIKSVI